MRRASSRGDLRARAAFTIAFALAACGGNRDAPRPIAPSPTLGGQQSEGGIEHMQNDDDGDGIANDHDGCPLAREAWDDPVRDGCPDQSVDAGVPPVPRPPKS